MNKNTRVRHAVRGFGMRYGDVLKGIEQCALTWVVEGETFRDLTEKEAYEARCQHARRRELFPVAELPGIVTRDIEGVRRELHVAWQGTLFAVPEMAEALVQANS